jgi:hypothetical protein
MEKDSSIYVYNSFQNPVVLDSTNDKLVIDCPMGKIEVILSRIMYLITKYGTTFNDNTKSLGKLN